MAHLKHKGRKKYEICIELGRDPRTGKRQRKYKTVENVTKQEAQSIMNDMIKKYKKSGFIDPDKVTVAKYLKKWLEEYAQRNVSARTFRDYNGVVRNHLIPYLGQLKLSELQSRHIIKYQNDKLDNGRLNGEGGLSKRTVENHHRILSQALKHAVHTYNILDSNPCNGVTAPQPDKPDINTLTEKEVNKLLDLIEDDYIFYTIIYVAVYTGLRRSELLALRWKDIDLDEQVLQVRRAVNEVSGQGLVYKETKNTSSQRSVNFDDDVTKVLRYYVKKQFKFYGKENLVFVNNEGEAIRPDYVTKKFKREIRKMNLEDVRFHDLRHTHATWLLKLGINPKIVQERLGHYDISTTLDVYSHVTPSMQKNAVKMLQKAKS